MSCLRHTVLIRKPEKLPNCIVCDTGEFPTEISLTIENFDIFQKDPLLVTSFTPCNGAMCSEQSKLLIIPGESTVVETITAPEGCGIIEIQVKLAEIFTLQVTSAQVELFLGEVFKSVDLPLFCTGTEVEIENDRLKITAVLLN